MTSYWVRRTAATALSTLSAGSFIYLWDEKKNNNNGSSSSSNDDDNEQGTVISNNVLDDNSRFTFNKLEFASPPITNIFSFSKTTFCEAPVQTEDSKKVDPKGPDPSYPNMTRFGPHSYLKRHLTPEVYAQLKDKKTFNGVTLEDLIQAGVCLPWAARPPRGVGVYAGDAESYKVFSLLLNPILEDYHHYRLAPQRRKRAIPGPKGPGKHEKPRPVSMLRRQVTNLNPRYVLQQNLDPDGQYILSTRMRVSRSIQGFAFSPTISREKRRKLEELFKECVEDWQGENDLKGEYFAVMDMTNEQHDDLIDRYVLFHDPDEFAMAAGLGRDWPDARGIYLDDPNDPGLTIWLNAEDHLRVITMSKGGDLLNVFTRLSKTLHEIEDSLKKRGHAFSMDSRLGFLNTSPENCGTALRASVFVKLPRLGQQPGFDELLERLRLDNSSRFKGRRYAGIFDIANAERLGQSEVQLINTMINGVGRLIALEKQLEKGEKINLDEIEVIN